MAKSSNQNQCSLLSQRYSEIYTKLKAKAQISYKSLRQFFYITFGV